MLHKIQCMKRAFGILLRFVSSLLKGLENNLKCVFLEFTPRILLIINYLSIDYGNSFFHKDFESNNLPEMRSFWQNEKNRFII